MRIHEVQSLIRERIRQELGSGIPECLYEKLWLRHAANLRELAEEDVCPADILKGDVGADYVDYMSHLLDGWGAAVESGDASPHRVSRSFRERLGKNLDHSSRDECIEQWWQVLPERDRQAVEAVWEFGYNVIGMHACLFREKFTGGRCLTAEEAIEWLSNPENGGNAYVIRSSGAQQRIERYLVSFEDLVLYPEDHWVSVYAPDAEVIVSSENRSSPIGKLLNFTMNNYLLYGISPSCLMQFMLTGERAPARLLGVVETEYGAFRRMLPEVVPLFPSYLSSEGVARVWQTVRYPAGAKSWALSFFNVSCTKSYVEACRLWNLVAPESWNIPDYRHFRRDLMRACLHANREPQRPQDYGLCPPVDWFSVQFESDWWEGWVEK